MVLHTGDFKIDQTPLDGDPMDVHRLAELGSAGVLALLADSTNVDRKGFSGSEIDVTDAFEEIFTGATGKIVVAMFASSLYRMQILVDLAAQFDRRVAFVGRGVIDNSEIAQRLGYLRVPAGVLIRDIDVRNSPAQDVVCICTGSQGEPQAALPRIAINDHRHVRLEPEDVVVFSAREIPGNEKAIGRVMNHIARRRGRGHLRGHQARPRFRARQRGRAQAHAFACKAALLRADTRGVPAARPSCPDRYPCVAEYRPCCWRRTATSSGSMAKAAGLPGKCRPGAC